MGEDAKTIAEAKAAVSAMNAQRRFPEGTTPACRHVAMMAEMLSGNGTYPMLADEPRYCATSLAATVRMLWEARAALRALPSATQAGGWMPPDIDAIENGGKRWHGEYHRVVSVRWEPYKPDGQRQMKAKGRWQEQVGAGDYWRWQNCERPSPPMMGKEKNNG